MVAAAFRREALRTSIPATALIQTRSLRRPQSGYSLPNGMPRVPGVCSFSVPAIARAGTLPWERPLGGIDPCTTMPEAAPPAFVQNAHRGPR